MIGRVCKKDIYEIYGEHDEFRDFKETRHYEIIETVEHEKDKFYGIIIRNIVTDASFIHWMTNNETDENIRILSKEVGDKLLYPPTKSQDF